MFFSPVQSPPPTDSWCGEEGLHPLLPSIFPPQYRTRCFGIMCRRRLPRSEITTVDSQMCLFFFTLSQKARTGTRAAALLSFVIRPTVLVILANRTTKHRTLLMCSACPASVQRLNSNPSRWTVFLVNGPRFRQPDTNFRHEEDVMTGGKTAQKWWERLCR